MRVIHVPMSEMLWPPKKRRKLRWRSARQRMSRESESSRLFRLGVAGILRSSCLVGDVHRVDSRFLVIECVQRGATFQFNCAGCDRS